MRGGRSVIHITYTWLVIALGAWVMVRMFSQLDLDQGRELLLLAFLGVLAEWLAVTFPQGQLSAGFTVVLATYLVFGPAAAVWTGALAIMCGQGIINRGNPLRATLFNAAQHVLAVKGGSLAFQLAGGSLPFVFDVHRLAPLLLFTAVYFLINQLLVYFFLAPRRVRSSLLAWGDALRWDALTYVFSAPLGVLTGLLFTRMGAGGVALFFIPVLVAQFILRLYVHQELANRELTALYQVARRLGERLDVKEIADLVLQESRRVAPCHSGVIYLWDEDRQRFAAAATAGSRAPELAGSSLARGEGFLGWVMDNGQAEIIYDAREDPRVKDQPGLFQVYRSLLIIPLLADAGTVGVFVLGDKRRLAFDDNHLQMLSIIAGQAAVSMANALLMRRLEESANTDGLTGIFNHRYFFRRAAEEYRRTQNEQLPLALIMLDIDSFKSVNDRFGHQAGDAVLAELAGLLRDAVGGSGIVARYGGEEFAVLLPGFGLEQVAAMAEVLRRRVREHEFVAADMSLQIRVSLGAAVCPGDADDVSALVRRADQALYRAKEKGKDRVVLASRLLKPGGH
ncbi:GGDEF domain-containing protein [Desulfotomaculum copahuensis]|uniref:GGDEF domain-containing protein n=1 Tax=Desulfotomaculum copahuensis TaxID=1838280 RepID=A0A1B7LC23_9FIRM|nr:sensor domain-containing diguanylate cyclase [Desulfotomaculum copahuensis]OAT80235.1 hypothetical protein A6M21_00845 [Desulfotomaculum copahuensis]